MWKQYRKTKYWVSDKGQIKNTLTGKEVKPFYKSKAQRTLMISIYDAGIRNACEEKLDCYGYMWRYKDEIE